MAAGSAVARRVEWKNMKFDAAASVASQATEALTDSRQMDQKLISASPLMKMDTQRATVQCIPAIFMALATSHT